MDDPRFMSEEEWAEAPIVRLDDYGDDGPNHEFVTAPEPPAAPEARVVGLMDALFNAVEAHKARRRSPPCPDCGGEGFLRPGQRLSVQCKACAGSGSAETTP